MNIPNPITKVQEWRSNRNIDKVRKKHSTSLVVKKKRHSTTKEKENNFLLLGLFAYLGSAIAAVVFDENIIMMAGFVSMFGFIGMIWIASLWQQWYLKSKLTITMNIVPDDPENNRIVKLRFEGVKVGTALESPDALIEFVKTQKGHLTHAVTPKEKDDAKQVFDDMEEKQNEMDTQLKLYPMVTKKDPIPIFLQMPHHYDEEFMAEEESVRLSYGRGKIRHAEITVFECEPIRTSIKVKDKIIDVAYALYTLYSSRKKMTDHQRGALWHTPTRVAQEVATYTKQNVDTNRNESYFAIIEKERNDAVQGRKKLQLQREIEQMNLDLDGDFRIQTRPQPKAPYSERDVIFGLILSFVAGILFMFIMGG